MIKKLLICFMSFVWVLSCLLLFLFVEFPESIFFCMDRMDVGIAHLYRSISIILKLIWISIVLESCSEVFWGIFLSAGDKKFPIILNISLLWGHSSSANYNSVL